MKKISLKSAVCAAVILASASAHAQQAESTINFHGIVFTIFDMTPDDGIAPGFSLTGGSSTFHLFAQDRDANTLADQTSHFDGLEAPVTQITTAGRLMSAQTGGTAGGSKVALGFDAIAGTAAVNSTTVWDFDLAPGTALLITGKLDYSYYRAEEYRPRMGGEMKVGLTATLGDEYLSTSNYAWEMWSRSAARSTNWNLSLFNGEDETVAGKLTLDVRNSVYTTVKPPIPEPSTYMMMATGTLLTAAALRRRRRIGQA